MAGVHPVTFWLSHLMWDYLIYMAVAAVVIVILVVTDTRDLFTTNDAAW